ncbi:hypothetical protein [Sphingomonas mollis]|uniref:DUF2314 domain-containing protein n=1 Tax=Sphingomonas mollis TaxID=2795726 RepID=A0ABS0XK87_9SPHN|nr:hypothetical protein [Sphingomonas sp. BT553]MBJ6120454.1 hypothetical protein [Sphingomonas sp. BT553]
MRMPDWSTDGWCLEDGEQRASAAPATFEIPSRELRQTLKPGDLAKLIFRIAVDDADGDDAVERMWVVVRERHPFGYVGVLDNQPSAIAKNDSLWSGTELPFEFRHIIAVDHATSESMNIVTSEPSIPWA